MTGLNDLKKSILTSALFKSEMFVKYRPLIVPLVVLAIAVLISVLVTVPQFLRLFETFKTIDALNAKMRFYQEKIAELERVNTDEFRADLDTSLAALPVEKNIPGVMGELLVALGGSGMTLDGISFSSSPAESDKLQEYSVIIDTSGNEFDLRNFLERVDLSPRLIKLAAIDVTKGNSDNSITASITFLTFYQQLPNIIGAADDPLPVITPVDTQVLADIQAKLRAFPKATPLPGGQTASGKLDPFAP